MSEHFEYKLFRISSKANSTLGMVMARMEQRRVDFRCFTLEDEHREEKVPGKTRIPAGTYEIKKRHGSPKFGHLDARWNWHKGMLWLRKVPGFRYVYIHAGNRHEDTDGCILVGDSAHSNVVDDGGVFGSRAAYERLYREISTMLDDGRQVLLTIEDVS